MRRGEREVSAACCRPEGCARRSGRGSAVCCRLGGRHCGPGAGGRGPGVRARLCTRGGGEHGPELSEGALGHRWDAGPVRPRGAVPLRSLLL